VTENGNGSFLIDFAERRAVSAGDKGLAAISRDGEWLAFAEDRQVVVRPRGGGGSPQTIATATQAVTEFSPHGRFLLVREPNDRVVVQDLRRRQTVLKSEGCHAAFSSDERRLALLDCKPREKAAAIRLESLDGSQKRLVFGAAEHFERAIDFAHAVVFSPDGRWLATGSIDGPLRVWSTADGRLLKTLSERSRTLDVAFSASGAELVATDGATARLWDPRRGVLLAAFTQPYEQLHAVRFVGDGEAVVAFACDIGLLPWEHVAVSIWTTERETRGPQEIAGLAKLVAANSGHVRRGLNPAGIRAP
jgi:WD40 repeat protein